MVSPDFTVKAARKAAAAAAAAAAVLLSLSIPSVVAAKSALLFEHHAVGRHHMPLSRTTAWVTSSAFTCIHVSDGGSGAAGTARASNRGREVKRQQRQRSCFSRANSQAFDGARLGVESVVVMAADAPGEQGYDVDSSRGRCRLDPLPTLKNRYFALRHGQSVANM